MPARSCSGSSSGSQPPVSSRRRADLADQGEVVRVGVQGLADQLVDHVRAVVLGGVDVVDAELDGPRSTASAWSWSRGGPNTPGPASCIAPKPTRATENGPNGKLCTGTA